MRQNSYVHWFQCEACWVLDDRSEGVGDVCVSYPCIFFNLFFCQFHTLLIQCHILWMCGRGAVFGMTMSPAFLRCGGLEYFYMPSLIQQQSTALSVLDPPGSDWWPAQPHCYLLSWDVTTAAHWQMDPLKGICCRRMYLHSLRPTSTIFFTSSSVTWRQDVSATAAPSVFFL